MRHAYLILAHRNFIVVRDELGAVGCQKADTLAFLNGRVYL